MKSDLASRNGKKRRKESRVNCNEVDKERNLETQSNRSVNEVKGKWELEVDVSIITSCLSDGWDLKTSFQIERDLEKKECWSWKWEWETQEGVGCNLWNLRVSKWVSEWVEKDRVSCGPRYFTTTTINLTSPHTIKFSFSFSFYSTPRVPLTLPPPLFFLFTSFF